MSNYEDPADELADYCDRNHTDRPDADCANCDQRREIQHCAQCGADFVDGRWYTALNSTAPNGCDHEGILDDWNREVLCQVKATMITRIPGFEGVDQKCGSFVAAGRDVCAFHARIQDAEECSRIYQRLVAVR